MIGVIRRHLAEDRIDETTARQSVEDLRDWPADRFAHGPLLVRAHELRHSVTSAEGLYVALAEAMDAPLLTLDALFASLQARAFRREL